MKKYTHIVQGTDKGLTALVADDKRLASATVVDRVVSISPNPETFSRLMHRAHRATSESGAEYLIFADASVLRASQVRA